MQADAFIILADTFTMQIDAFIMQADTLTMQIDTFTMQCKDAKLGWAGLGFANAPLRAFAFLHYCSPNIYLNLSYW
jgi:hypothetical protein